jgi:peptide/nickel transport system ATP-binding protein
MAMSTAAPLLEIQGLDISLPKGADRPLAVSNASFTLMPGRTVCIVGESGSGKSTVADGIMGLLPRPHLAPVAGRILFGGRDLLTLDDAGMRSLRGREIGMVFQEPMAALNPLMKIGAQLEEVLEIHLSLPAQERRRRALAALADVGLPRVEELYETYPFRLSGGQRQRVVIACAMMLEPRLLICDEPTTALDVTTQAEILDLIKRLQTERGMAMLLITHDMGVVAEVADDVAVMRFGRIVETGSVDAIFHAPQHAYTQRLLASTLKLEQPAEARAEAVVAPRPILELKNLTKVYGGAKGFLGTKKFALKAVDDVSLVLHAGENLGVVGESGSGKTTLGRLILRTVEPTAGQVLYRQKDGKEIDVTSLSKADLRKFHADVRLIFQDPFASLNPRMTIRQIVGDPLVVEGKLSGKQIEEKVAELLRLVGLSPDVMERYPHAFSGGQRQRIGIARALALDPRIIIADEATSALDVSIRSQILDLLLEIQSRLDLSFIFISHDISVVRYFCDRVAVMHRGKLVEVGPAEKICTAPDADYTRALISAVPNPDPRNKRMLHRTRLASLST